MVKNSLLNTSVGKKNILPASCFSACRSDDERCPSCVHTNGGHCKLDLCHFEGKKTKNNQTSLSFKML